jgi:hypothetical protein
MIHSSIASVRCPARRLLVAILVGSTAAAVSAAESAPPTRSHLQPVSELAHAPVSGESLGIRLSRASAVLRQQLALARGAGLVVDEVAAGTRAERAGFRQHDVLVRLDDQLLVLPQQFDALLEAAAADDPLTCTVLRGGRELSIPLTGRPAAAAVATDVPTPAPPRRPLRPTASSLALLAPPASAPSAVISDGRLRRLSDETLLRQDADFEIRLSRGDQTRLLVRDRAGRIVFDGPIDAAADRGRVPEVVRSRVATMERLLEPRPALAGDTAGRPVAEIGRLEIPPVELR